MSNQAQNLLKEIQFRTGKSIEDIAKDIGYSRPYLNNVKNKGGGEKIIGILKAKYYSVLQDALNERLAEKNEVDPYHDKYIDSLLEQKRILETQNDFLRRNFETSLDALLEGQQNIGSQISGMTYYSILALNEGDHQKTLEVISKLNNGEADALGLTGKDGNLDKADSGRTGRTRQQR